MIITMPKPNPRLRNKGTSLRIKDTVSYVFRNPTLLKDPNGDNEIFTNAAIANRDDIICDMRAWTTLNPNVKSPDTLVRHVILSPEKNDRELTTDEWQKAIDIYRAERGLDDALYAAVIHQDGHSGRHPQHCHLVYVGLKPDGKTVPTSLDSEVHRRASRRIEAELNLEVNAGATHECKYNGRAKNTRRDRSAERQNFTQEQVQVNAQAVADAVNKSHDLRSLRENLAAVGIEMRCRRHSPDTEIYAWSLNNKGCPIRTSGSKVTTKSGELGWKNVQKILDTNRAARRAIKVKGHKPRRRQGATLAQTGSHHIAPNNARLDQAAAAAMNESMNELLNLLQRFKTAKPVQKAKTSRRLLDESHEVSRHSSPCERG